MGEILLKATWCPQGVPEGQTLMFPLTAAFEFLVNFNIVAEGSIIVKGSFSEFLKSDFLIKEHILKVDPKMPNKILAVKFSQL